MSSRKHFRYNISCDVVSNPRVDEKNISVETSHNFVDNGLKITSKEILPIAHGRRVTLQIYWASQPKGSLNYSEPSL